MIGSKWSSWMNIGNWQLKIPQLVRVFQLAREMDTAKKTRIITCILQDRRSMKKYLALTHVQRLEPLKSVHFEIGFKLCLPVKVLHSQQMTGFEHCANVTSSESVMSRRKRFGRLWIRGRNTFNGSAGRNLPHTQQQMTSVQIPSV